MFKDRTQPCPAVAPANRSAGMVRGNAQYTVQVRVARAAIAALACALLSPTAQAASVRDEMRRASDSSRNASFTAFFANHNKQCSVGESQFGASTRVNGLKGDLWSVRCHDGRAFAVLIGADSKATSWFMPCETAERASNLRCFDRIPAAIEVK